MQVVITVTGGPELQQKLEHMGQEMLDFSAEFLVLGDQLKSYLSNEVYLSQGSVFGQSWAPLNEAYATRKATRYPGHRILDASGLMRDSYIAATTPESLTITNDQEYAKYHQLGTTKMPQRLLFSINDTMKITIAEVIKAGIAQKLENL